MCESKRDNQNVVFKIFIRRTGGRTKLPFQLYRSKVGLGRNPASAPIPHPSATADIESLFSRDESPSKLGEKHEFGNKLKTTAWELANEFSETSNLLGGMYKAQAPKGEIALLVIEAISLRAKSTAEMKAIIKHVSCLMRFYLEVRGGTNVELTGGQSAALLRDYLESLAERGRTAPAAAKHALTVRAEALGIDSPLTNPLVCSEALVETTETPKQAPSMSLSTVRAFEEMAVNKPVNV